MTTVPTMGFLLLLPFSCFWPTELHFSMEDICLGHLGHCKTLPSREKRFPGAWADTSRQSWLKSRPQVRERGLQGEGQLQSNRPGRILTTKLLKLVSPVGSAPYLSIFRLNLGLWCTLSLGELSLRSTSWWLLPLHFLCQNFSSFTRPG